MNNLYFYISKLFFPLINFTNFFILLIIFLFFVNFFYKNKKIITLVKNLIILIFIIGIFPIGNIGLKLLESDYLTQSKFAKIDNIIVLGGPENIETSNLIKKTDLKDSSERLISSVKLALDYPNAKIYYIGGGGLIKKNGHDEIDIAKNFYEDVGFDIRRINFFGEKRNTLESIKKISDLNISKQQNIIITSAYHMKRSLIISKKFDLNLIPYGVDFRSLNSKSLINNYQTFMISKNLFKMDLFVNEIIGIIVAKIFL